MSRDSPPPAPVPPPLPLPRHFPNDPSQPVNKYGDAIRLMRLRSRKTEMSTAGEEGYLNWLEQPSFRTEASTAQAQGPSFSTSSSGMDMDELKCDDIIPTAIVIKNIPYAVKKEQLVAIMSEMQLPLPYAFNYHFDNGIFRGLAFANFTANEDTRHVIKAMNGMELQGRKLKVEYKRMLPAEERERIEREKREKRGQLERAYSHTRSDHSPSSNTGISTGNLYRRRGSISRQSPKPGTHSGYASSNHSSTSIRSYGSNNSYTCSVRLARGVPDTESETRSSGLERRHSSSIGRSTSSCFMPLYGLARKNSTPEFHNVERGVGRSSEGDHQRWEEFCVLQLVAFLQVCTLDDVHSLTRSPPLLRERFKTYLKRMLSQEGNADFLLYQASPRPGQPEAQLQLLRHHKSIFSKSRSSMRSYSSRTSHSSASTASSFSSQISDGTLLNHVQQEAKNLRDCLIKIQKKLKHLDEGLEGAQSNKGQELPAVKDAPFRTLEGAIKMAIEWLRSKEGGLGLLGFSDMSLLFTKFHREFAAIYKDLQSLKRQNKFQKVFRPGRSKQEIGERINKYDHIHQAVHAMMRGIAASLETAETQKAVFIAAGKPCVSASILEAVAELGYISHDTFNGSHLEMRMFLKFDDP